MNTLKAEVSLNLEFSCSEYNYPKTTIKKIQYVTVIDQSTNSCTEQLSRVLTSLYTHITSNIPIV